MICRTLEGPEEPSVKVRKLRHGNAHRVCDYFVSIYIVLRLSRQSASLQVAL